MGGLSPTQSRGVSPSVGTVYPQAAHKHSLTPTERVESAHKLAAVLKACRHNWLSAREVAGLIGCKGEVAMRWLCALHEEGMLETRHMSQGGGKPGNWPRVFRVAPEWRNGG